MLYKGFDWQAFLITFALTYPLWCFGVQSVKFFEDCIIVFRPFIFCKKIILYEQVDHIKEVTYGRTTAVLVPYDVYILYQREKTANGNSHAIIFTGTRKVKTIDCIKGHTSGMGHF